MQQFTIASAYCWSVKNNDEKMKRRNVRTSRPIIIPNSELAIKHLASMIKNRFNGKTKNNIKYNINYRRLRASAGRTMLDSIIKRIETAQVIVFDLTRNSPNVFLELGIALSISRDNEYPSIYLIKELTLNEYIMTGLPSDLQGYFITSYKVVKGKVVFKDDNSLRMSIESDVKDYYNQQEPSQFNQIDEINFDERKK
jgi:hypothetical protein